ncbi:hypothetical protein ON010_g912 [Phytophthora cinnamomi]|nr:hypothetical protein ON010_g912 [Phytophthora cinnamomi]
MSSTRVVELPILRHERHPPPPRVAGRAAVLVPGAAAARRRLQLGAQCRRVGALRLLAADHGQRLDQKLRAERAAGSPRPKTFRLRPVVRGSNWRAAARTHRRRERATLRSATRQDSVSIGGGALRIGEQGLRAHRSETPGWNRTGGRTAGRHSAASPRWLASAGREAEAVAAVENLERAHVSRVNYDRVSEEGLPETEETSVSVETEALVESGKSSSSSSVRDKPLGAATARLWTLWAVMELSGYALGKYVPILISLWGFNMFSRWTTAVLLGLVQVSGSVLASMKLEEVGLKKLLVCCAAPAALVAVVLSYAPWNGPVVVVGTCAVSALLAAAWSCVLVSAPSNFSTEVRGRGVGYAFGFSRLATVIGSWLYPRMFNLWRMSAPAIAWAFAVLLVLAVLWFTLPFEPARSSMQSKYIVELTDVNTRDKVNQDEDEEDLPPVVTHNSDSERPHVPLEIMSAVHRRIDSLNARLSWFYVRLLLVTGISWAVHSAELVLFLFTRRLVARNVGMGTRALEALGVSIFVGAALGGPLFGRIADSRGRRSALLLSMSLSLLGLAMSALATRHYHVIVARVVAGVGLGGELPAATVLVQELSPRPMQGKMVALLESFTGVGSVVGVALAFGLAPQVGWRITYLAICGLVLYVWVLRFGLPESPRWLAGVGRVDEALLVVGKLEEAHGNWTPIQNLTVQGDSTVAPKVAPRINLSIDKFVLWTLWSVMALSAYALGVYVPALISLWGFNVFSRWSTMALLGVAQTAGCVLAAFVLDEFDRKLVLACFSTIAAVVAVLTSLAPWNGPFVVGGMSVVSGAIAASWSCVLVYAPENFVTEYRGRGVGYAFGFSRLGATIGCLLGPYMFNVWKMSIPAIAWAFAVLLVVVMLGLAFLSGRNTLARKDEDGLEPQKAYRLFDSSPGEEGMPLVSSNSSETATYNF